MVKILGIDPGLRRTGWAVIEINGQNHRQIGAGTILSESKSDLAERLHQIFRGLCAVITQYEPDEAAVEEVFVNMDARATLKLGQARGMSLLAPRTFGIPVAEYAANQVKKTVVGAGHADKSQIEYMVRLQIKNANPEGADAADALAIALCHALRRRARSLVA